MIILKEMLVTKVTTFSKGNNLVIPPFSLHDSVDVYIF